MMCIHIYIHIYTHIFMYIQICIVINTRLKAIVIIPFKKPSVAASPRSHGQRLAVSGAAGRAGAVPPEGGMISLGTLVESTRAARPHNSIWLFL